MADTSHTLEIILKETIEKNARIIDYLQKLNAQYEDSLKKLRKLEDQCEKVNKIKQKLAKSAYKITQRFKKMAGGIGSIIKGLSKLSASVATFTAAAAMMGKDLQRLAIFSIDGNRAIENLRDGIKNIGETAVTSLHQAAEAMANFNKQSLANMIAMKGTEEGFIKLHEAAVQIAGLSGGELFGDMVANLAPEDLSLWAKAMRVAITDTSRAMEIISGIPSLTKEAVAMNNAILSHAEGFDKAVEATTSWQKVLMKLKALWSKVVDAFTTALGNDLINLLEDFTDNLLPKVLDSVKRFFEFVSRNKDLVINALKSIAGEIQKIIEWFLKASPITQTFMALLVVAPGIITGFASVAAGIASIAAQAGIATVRFIALRNATLAAAAASGVPAAGAAVGLLATAASYAAPAVVGAVGGYAAGAGYEALGGDKHSKGGVGAQIAGGAGTGALIGTAVLGPGVGTAVGAAIGAVTSGVIALWNAWDDAADAADRHKASLEGSVVRIAQLQDQAIKLQQKANEEGYTALNTLNLQNASFRVKVALHQQAVDEMGKERNLWDKWFGDSTAYDAAMQKLDEMQQKVQLMPFRENVVKIETIIEEKKEKARKAKAEGKDKVEGATTVDYHNLKIAQMRESVAVQQQLVNKLQKEVDEGWFVDTAKLKAETKELIAMRERGYGLDAQAYEVKRKFDEAQKANSESERKKAQQSHEELMRRSGLGGIDKDNQLKIDASNFNLVEFNPDTLEQYVTGLTAIITAYDEGAIATRGMTGQLATMQKLMESLGPDMEYGAERLGDAMAELTARSLERASERIKQLKIGLMAAAKDLQGATLTDEDRLKIEDKRNELAAKLNDAIALREAALESIGAEEKRQARLQEKMVSVAESRLEIFQNLYGAPGLAVDAQMAVVEAMEQQKILEMEALQRLQEQLRLTPEDAPERIRLLEEEAEQRVKINQLTSKQLQQLKELRDGYLDAVQAQAFGAGAFEKILITQEKNIGKAMDENITKRNFLTGQVQDDAARADITPGRFLATPGGFEGTRNAENIADEGARTIAQAGYEMAISMTSNISALDSNTRAIHAAATEQHKATAARAIPTGSPAGGVATGEAVRTGAVPTAIDTRAGRTEVAVPEVEIPEVAIPDLKVPEVEIPEITVPEVVVQKLQEETKEYPLSADLLSQLRDMVVDERVKVSTGDFNLPDESGGKKLSRKVFDFVHGDFFQKERERELQSLVQEITGAMKKPSPDAVNELAAKVQEKGLDLSSLFMAKNLPSVEQGAWNMSEGVARFVEYGQKTKEQMLAEADKLAIPEVKVEVPPTISASKVPPILPADDKTTKDATTDTLKDTKESSKSVTINKMLNDAAIANAVNADAIHKFASERHKATGLKGIPPGSAAGDVAAGEAMRTGRISPGVPWLRAHDTRGVAAGRRAATGASRINRSESMKKKIKRDDIRGVRIITKEESEKKAKDIDKAKRIEQRRQVRAIGKKLSTQAKQVGRAGVAGWAAANGILELVKIVQNMYNKDDNDTTRPTDSGNASFTG